MKHIFFLVLFSFTFVDQLQASNVCLRFFGMFQRSPVFASSYDYNPRNADQIVATLLKDNTLERIKKSNFKKDHIPFFDNYVLEGISVLEKIKTEREIPEITAAVDKLVSQAQSRLGKQITKEWVLIFSSKLSAIIDGEPESDFRRLQKMLEVREDVLLPTFASLDFEHFVEMENKPVAFIGIFEAPAYIDGEQRPLDAREAAEHDFAHYQAIKHEEKVLDPEHPEHKTWIRLHNKILKKIKELPLNKRRYAEFIYFYTLRENEGFREFYTYAYKIKSLEQATQRRLKYEVIKAHYSGVPHARISITVVDLHKRMNRENDFKNAFPNKNPQEVLLVGLDSFFTILGKIDSGGLY